MKSFSRIIAILVTVSIVFSLSGCFDYSYIDETVDSITTTDENAQVASTDNININLPYITSDSLNPFTAKTEINRNLSTLIYDSLFNVENDFRYTALMAESYSLRNDELIVKLKTNLKFSDLGNVSANDVVYSFDIAKASDRYKGILSSIESADTTDNRTVTFTFSKNVTDPCALLTFPIIKTGSMETSDDKKDVPIGSGRYILSKNTNNELYLTANSGRLGDFSPIYKNIGLVATNNEKIASSTFSLGHTNILIDTYSDGEYEKYIGATNKQNLTNFVYLVCNPKNEIFDDSNVKKAISIALDRNEIADYSFISFAKPTYSPFHPDYYRTVGYDYTELNHNIDFANKILDSIGYSEINPTYNFRHSDGKIMEFDLAVSKDNAFKLSAAQIIKTQLSKVSIYVNIKLYSQEDFLKAVSSGKYDMYLGECKLTNNLDLSPFFDNGNSVSSGIPDNTECEKKYSQYLNGEIEITEFLNAFNQDMPFIPILYRCASVNSNSAMAVSNSSIVSDYYNNVDKWKSVND